MEFHFLLRILLHSLVRMKWFAAESCDRRRQGNIMNAFIGRLGFPAAFGVGNSYEASAPKGAIMVTVFLVIMPIYREWQNHQIVHFISLSVLNQSSPLIEWSILRRRIKYCGKIGCPVLVVCTQVMARTIREN